MCEWSCLATALVAPHGWGSPGHTPASPVYSAWREPGSLLRERGPRTARMRHEGEANRALAFPKNLTGGGGARFSQSSRVFLSLAVSFEGKNRLSSSLGFPQPTSEPSLLQHTGPGFAGGLGVAAGGRVAGAAGGMDVGCWTKEAGSEG